MATQTLPSAVITKRLEGKIAIVTGGDQGIGRAIALRASNEEGGFANAIEVFILGDLREFAKKAS